MAAGRRDACSRGGAGTWGALGGGGSPGDRPWLLEAAPCALPGAAATRPWVGAALVAARVERRAGEPRLGEEKFNCTGLIPWLGVPGPGGLGEEPSRARVGGWTGVLGAAGVVSGSGSG